MNKQIKISTLTLLLRQITMYMSLWWIAYAFHKPQLYVIPGAPTTFILVLTLYTTAEHWNDE